MNDVRRRTPWILLGAVLLAGATALAVFTLERSPDAPPPIARPGPAPIAPTVRENPPPDPSRGADSPRTTSPKPAPDPALPVAEIPRAIRGEVRTRSGQPIAGADVVITLIEPSGEHEIGSAKSDAAGRFQAAPQKLEEFDPTRRALGQLVATARARGFQSQKQEIHLRSYAVDSATPLVFTFTLTAGNVVAGRIVDRAGAPVAGAEVQLLVDGSVKEKTPKTAALPERSVCARDRTGLDGRFALNFVSAGTYQLAAREPSVGTAFVESLELGADDDHALKDIALQGDGILAGDVRYPGGAPARALELWAIPDWISTQPNPLSIAALKAPELERNEGLLYGRATSDSSGHFRFSGLKPGNYAIRCPRDEVVLEPHHLQFAPGTENIALEVQTYRLVVRVKDAAGMPLSGADVACAEMSLAQDGHLDTVKAQHDRAAGPDATATFEIEPDRTYALTATSPGCTSAEDMAILAPGEYEHQRELVLRPASAKGRLHVTLEGAGNLSPSLLEIAFYSALTEQRSETIGVVSPDAQGWIASIPPGKYRLQIGFGADEGELAMFFPIPTRETVEIRPGAATEHLVRARPGARVRLALDVRGTPVGPTTSHAPAGGAGGDKSADKQRAKELRERGASATVACGPNGEPRPVQFVEPAEQLPKRFTLASRLAPGGSALIADLLEPGECTLRVEAPGYPSAEAHVTLRPGVVEDVRIELVGR